MEFEDSFAVAASPEAAWNALTDIERVYPCLPGAELKEIKDNEFHGLVTLRLGPITAVYQGRARFDDLDPDGRTLVIHAEGRDKHGQGTARARVSAKLIPENGTTRVEMRNEVDITGKAAQFGRGILQDVSKEILGEFAANLQRVVVPASAAGDDAGAQPGGGSSSGPAPQGQATRAQSISVIGLGRRVVVRRVRESPLRATATVAVLVAAAAVVIWLLSR